MTQRDVAGAGRSIAAPGRFADDDGAPDPAIRDASDPAALVEALRSGRVLVAVVAVAHEIEEVDGLPVDKSSDMAVVSMIAPDGRRGLLAFSGLDSLQAWNPQARPVPVSGTDAATAAIEDGCEAIVIDVAGPRTQVVPESDVIAVLGLAPLEHARQVAQRHFDATFGDQRVLVTLADDRLRISAVDQGIDAHALAAALSPRIVALVPAGIEIEQA